MRVRLFRPPDGRINYGDELNNYLWDSLLGPETAKILPDALFVGIGTFLNSDLPYFKKVIVCGGGAGYGPPPKMHDGWKIYFVRGPRTAQSLGLDKSLAVTDPVILLSKYYKREKPKYKVSFMPRWDTASEPPVKTQCEKLGIHIIDPRNDVPKVIDDISSSDLLLSEALHGAVTADALGVPWIPILYRPTHEFKWHDWCESVGLEYKPVEALRLPLQWAAEHVRPVLSDRKTSESLCNEAYDRVMLMKDDMLNKRGIFNE